ncbi:MAG: hypothetical protein K940chlam3_01496, partial [Chlamydiae bacterium]|nr:hypothetical protein [Chlamydiota bacterium]
MISNSVPLIHLPEEINLQIFSYMKPSELSTCCRVRNSWNNFLKDDSLWTELFHKNNFNRDMLKGGKIKDFLDKKLSRLLKSGDEIIDRIQKFADSIHFGKNGVITCASIHDGSPIIKLTIIGAPSRKEEI